MLLWGTFLQEQHITSRTPKPSAGMAGSHSSPTRARSLDLLRGGSMAAMLLVNYPGDSAAVWAQLRHPGWIGLHLADFIFPFFLFSVGVSATLSFERRIRKGHGSLQLYRHVLVRAAKLFALGLILVWLKYFELRFGLGTLQAIAVAYLCASPALRSKNSSRAAAVALFFGAYLLFSNLAAAPEVSGGREQWNKGLTALERLEAAAAWTEDLVPAVSSATSVVLGMIAGTLLGAGRLLRAGTATGVLLVAGGALLQSEAAPLWLYSPFSLKLWTPSFTLFTGGCAFLALALFHRLVDARPAHWIFPFQVLGANAIVAYFATSALDRLVLKPRSAEPPLRDILYAALSSQLPPAVASYCYSAGVLLFAWLLCYLLWRRQIFVRL